MNIKYFSKKQKKRMAFRFIQKDTKKYFFLLKFTLKIMSSYFNIMNANYPLMLDQIVPDIDKNHIPHVVDDYRFHVLDVFPS